MNPENINLAITLLLSALNRASEIGTLISKARSENRDISDAELDALAENDDVAREALEQAIKDKKV